ncbi:hypothetical protein LEMA_P036770.1 [Plenodomus lingam JN3]|uniref:Calcium channel YVC1-like C-terminal transmembrane domain-containing protein n=1 Tax=Leptosphaeria maculans (strain JN3 / isolate v23.1.3 / race Av1-4-5-6-7-8) TaxID=985895 RepID=E4ZQJ8_LEPMJ|nr:hypothetical protein LEMA_P036770.1 [Plenodomus lingam JN3]CBX94003.1 hypothetical protein LEMA_P036770.1 [Plenodomus lingam JN3]
MHQQEPSDMSLPSTPRLLADEIQVPEIDGDEKFSELVDKFSQFFEHAIRLPHTFEDLRRSQEGRALQPLIEYLSTQVEHPCTASALLALKGHFSALEENSDVPGVNQARGYACEFVAWQFVSNLKDSDAMEYLLVELPPLASSRSQVTEDRQSVQGDGNGNGASQSNERTPLLPTSNSDYFGHNSPAISRFSSLTSQCENLSALEIASVSGAKKFLGQRPVQKLINGLFKGDIVFWETLSVNSIKRPRKYNRRQADPFSRLRVPLYLKVFETLFFGVFLALYYAVLVARNEERVTVAEIMLYVWIASFAYDEFADWTDAGQTSFYASDFWWTWDISIVVVGMIFCVLRIVGLTTASTDTMDLAYDVLGLEALFLIPRIFALLSLNRYFGTLIPCLKEMTKDFVKFLSLVVILYLGFLTTFVLLARGTFSAKEMSWILIKVFFGSSYLGFDIAEEITCVYTYSVSKSKSPLSLHDTYEPQVANSDHAGYIAAVLDHARDEYLFIFKLKQTYLFSTSSAYSVWASAFSQYSIQPCAAAQAFSTVAKPGTPKATWTRSARWTLKTIARLISSQNLIPLIIRPLRLFLPSERLREVRIVLLKATHVPFVGAIWVYEQLANTHKPNSSAMSLSGPQIPSSKKLPRLPVNSPRLLMADGQVARMHHTSRSHTRTGVPEPDAQLRNLVLKLSAQVEELTTMVSQLSEQREASPAAA